MLRVYVPLFAMPSDFNVDNPIVYFSPINIQLPLYNAHDVPNHGMSKNNFWWVKPFKYNGLGSQLIDKCTWQYLDDVKTLTNRQKTNALNRN